MECMSKLYEVTVIVKIQNKVGSTE